MSNYLGLPPHLCTHRELQRIHDISRELAGTIPSTFLAHTEIQQVVGAFNVELDGIGDHTLQQSLVGVFEAQLDGIRSKYQFAETTHFTIDLEAAKLYLYALSLTFPPAQSSASSQHPSSFRTKILAKTLNSASNLIRLVDTLRAIRAATPFPFSPSLSSSSSTLVDDIIYYPKWYFTATYFAAISLYKYLALTNSSTTISMSPSASSFDAGSLDVNPNLTLATQSLMLAHSLFESVSFDRDIKRAAMELETLDRLARETRWDAPTASASFPTSDAELFVRNRLGASLQYDASFRTQMYRNTNQSTVLGAHRIRG